MKWPPISNEEEYNLALKRLAELLDFDDDSDDQILRSEADDDEREALLEAIEEYEDELEEDDL